MGGAIDGAMVSEEESLNDVGMSLDGDELLMIGGLLEGITVPSMDVAMEGAMVGREESLYEIEMLVSVDELLMIGELLEENNAMDGAMVGRKESLNDVRMLLDGDGLLLIGGLLEGSKKLLLLLHTEGILEALYIIKVLLMVVDKGKEGLG